MQLVAPHIDGKTMSGAFLQSHIAKTARRGTNVDDGFALYRIGKMRQRFFKL